MKVCFRDHKQLAKNTTEAGGIDYEKVLLPSLSNLATETDKLAEAERSVVHFSPDELVALKKDWSTAQVTVPCAMFLVVSKGGKSGLVTANHDRWKRKTNGATAYVLYARNQADVLEGDASIAIAALKAFYRMSNVDADNILSERVSDVYDENLQRLFAVASEPETLIALSILCQGYLIVHAKHGHMKGVPESLRESSGQLPDPVTPLAKVQEHGFWGVFGQEDREELVKAAKSEWGGSIGGGDLGAIETLIRGLPTKDKALKGEDVLMVAKAYDAIAERMGAKSGK